jgi:superfamily II DNA or RNA helicase
VASEFREAGYKAFAVDGSMEDDERTRILAGLGNGRVHVVASCDLISEGTDIPAIGCAILLRPTQSTGLYIQQVGRALRPCEGKERAVILDHVGNVFLHGLPDSEREWSLEGEQRKMGKKQESKGPRVVQCPKCYTVHEPAPMCPSCGHVDLKAGRKLETQEGELQEIKEAASIADTAKKQARKEVGRAQTLEELKELARQRGYKPGWAEHIYNARRKGA